MHKSFLAAVAAVSFAVPTAAQRYDLPPAPHDEIAWDFVEGITTEVGPRLQGTEQEARGRAWAMEWLEAHGFENVVEETFPLQLWLRGEERGAIVSPFAQQLILTALGNSGSTGAEGITAEVVHFASTSELAEAPAGSLAGKIVYIGHAMQRTMDGSHYGWFGSPRRQGPGMASAMGAAAVVIRSIGTSDDRLPHTGYFDWPEGVDPIPAAALSNPDANNLERMFARAGGEPITMRLLLTPTFAGEGTSGNVTGEIVGRDPSLPPVLLACHLDSWGLGTGAVDDANGCAVAATSALRAAERGQPLRTIRVLFAGAEENFKRGSIAYSAAHIDERIGVGLESDFGNGRIWRIESNFADTNRDLYMRLAQAVEGFGVAPSPIVASGGADLDIVRDQGGAIIDLQQDGTHYFDLHHTANDTLDKVDPANLAQNVAVWTQVVGILANEAGSIQGEGE